MKYGFIGCGSMGGAIARALSHVMDIQSVEITGDVVKGTGEPIITRKEKKTARRADAADTAV